MSPLQDVRRDLARVLANPEDRAIARRYFISNGFDGTLTSIGVTVGAYLGGIESGLTVVTIGVGAAVGLATSGVWSVWEIERAERHRELVSLESAMLQDLHGTAVGERRRKARLFHSVMSGLGPTLGILLPVVPFLLVPGALTMLEATLASVAVGVSVLFAFGTYLARVSGLSWWRSGLRMGVAGLFVAIVNWLLPG